MPKYKDFFSKLKDQGKINSPEFEEYLKTVPDAEIPDAVVKAIEDNFMTMERATAHKDVHGKIKREVLDPVDNDLKLLVEQLKEYIDPSIEHTLNTEGNTYNKLRAITKLIPESLKKAKGSPVTDEETKKKLVEYEKTVQELTDKFGTAEKEYKNNLKHTETEWENKFHDFRLNTELQSLGNKFTLAEAFEEIRPNITEVIMSKIRSSNSLKLGEKDGRPVIHVNDENGKPKFNGNTPVTVDTLLEEAFKPYLKKSESEARRENPKTTTTVKAETPTIRRGAPTAIVQK
jgi:hypothetical protein